MIHRPHPAGHAPSDPGMSRVVSRNIRSLAQVREREQRRQSLAGRIAGLISGFAGSMWFVGVHLVLLALWLLINGGVLPWIEPWDPFPFTMLAVAASVEAIFLSAFILITQNRMQAAAGRRAELDLQISLLAEHELTQAMRLLDAIAEHLHIPRPSIEDLEDTKRDVDPDKLAGEIELAEATTGSGDET